MYQNCVESNNQKCPRKQIGGADHQFARREIKVFLIFAVVLVNIRRHVKAYEEGAGRHAVNVWNREQWTNHSKNLSRTLFQTDINRTTVCLHVCIKICEIVDH